MSEIRIREAAEADANTLAEYNRALALESEDRVLPADRVRRGVVHLLANRDLGIYYVAEADGAIVGQLGLTFEWSDWRNGMFWWIQSVYVHPDWREKGVFSALFRHVLDAARADGLICGLRLYAERDNDTALAVYRHLGMEITDYRMLEIDFSE